MNVQDVANEKNYSTDTAKASDTVVSLDLIFKLETRQ